MSGVEGVRLGETKLLDETELLAIVVIEDDAFALHEWVDYLLGQTVDQALYEWRMADAEQASIGRNLARSLSELFHHACSLILNQLLLGDEYLVVLGEVLSPIAHVHAVECVELKVAVGKCEEVSGAYREGEQALRRTRFT